MSQHSLRPNPGSRKRSRSLGRGDSSGHGSFSGHGGKGQTARSGGNIKAGFEGGQTPLIRRLPKLKGFKNPNRLPYQTVNVESFNDFEDGSTVDIVVLYENRLISRKNRPVKILGNGELTKKLTIKADACSVSAKQKIEAKGGEVLLPTLPATKAPGKIKQDV
ncbi:50S ribosomal protein L15 [Candidatus Peregrinibacteria bacterium]|nr:50S ribosomal protein L15 [Candidatus Peregrinibacteria bacterium]